ncbi:hypothetical protein Patl1_04206 [Pistacia atlantica]|uniref:Uncharacterized protein n=1 Tax=Pistacia atlantica TaxID=434234 RepID=A0ACC1BTU6_9ROSI|nr:hypothetical protein Patl1_04206 [Pistacia atlantica]
MLEPSFQFSNSAMEGATKWDSVCFRTSDEAQQIYSNIKLLDQQELETGCQFSIKKLEHFLRKASAEKAAWRSREREKIRVFIDDLKGELNRERKNRQRVEIVNSKFVNELADAKFAAKRYMRDYEKERKARELIEEVCDELAKEIGEDKSEVEALKRDSMKLREEAEDERKMLQMAEVWHEKRAQMKLVDAKGPLEEENSHMNRLVADLETFLRSRSATPDVAVSMNIQDIKELTYESPNPDDIFSVFEDVNFGEPIEREIEQCGAYSPSAIPQKFVLILKWKKMIVDGKLGMEWDDNGYEGTPITEISEVCSGPTKKKVSSIARLWRSGPNNGENYKIITVQGMKGRLSNGRLSNGSIASPDRGSGKGGLSPPDLTGQWSSPDSGNPHITRGMKGCIEWPRGALNNSLKAKLLEARIESQNLQL